MSDLKKIVSAAAVAYAVANIAPVIEKLNTLSENTTSQNKLLAYHVFETCILAEGEKVSHAMLEQAVNMPFDKRVSAKGRKVADYVMNGKPFYDNAEQETIKLTPDMFQGDKPKYHVMTVYGQIAAQEKQRRDAKADTKSVVEQALAASGLPIELADKQIALANEGNDTAASFVKSALEKFTPATKEKADEKPVNVLEAAMETLIAMDPVDAAKWVTDAIELLGLEAVEDETQQAPLEAVA